MNLRDLNERVRLLWLALQEECDLERKKEIELLYKATREQISDLIADAPF